MLQHALNLSKYLNASYVKMGIKQKTMYQNAILFWHGTHKGMVLEEKWKRAYSYNELLRSLS